MLQTCVVVNDVEGMAKEERAYKMFASSVLWRVIKHFIDVGTDLKEVAEGGRACEMCVGSWVFELMMI